jgi:hypothetical protein
MEYFLWESHVCELSTSLLNNTVVLPLRAFCLEAFAAPIGLMHQGGDGKAFVQQLKRNGHARSSGGGQYQDSWFTHGMELLFDT